MRLNRRQLIAAGGSFVFAAGSATAQTPSASPVATPVASSPDIPWWKQSLFYEVFVRSFQDSDGDGIGDFTGILNRLPYLNSGHQAQSESLHVGALWMMPIMPSPSYHGYDVTEYRDVNPDYGSLDDLRALLAAMHERNMRLIVDLPINHTSSQHPWFQEAVADAQSPYRDWYIFSDTDPGYPGPWGQQVWHPSPGGGFYYGIFDSSMPDLNFRNPAVTAEVEDICRFWLEDVGVDGFRMDAIKHVIEEDRVQENTPETIQWLRDFQTFLEGVRADVYTVGEVMNNTTDSIQPYYPDTLTEFFQFDLAQQMVNAANFGGARQLLRTLGGAVDRLPDQRFATFLTNHDQPRIATALKEDPAKLRVAAMMLLTFPGTPFMYYGEEIGLPGTKPDEDIRTPMQWNNEPGGGFTTGTAWSPMQPGWEATNVASEERDPASVLGLYREWTAVRASSPALQYGSYTSLETGVNALVAFLRETDTERVLVAINLGNAATETATLTMPAGTTGVTNATPLIHAGELTATEAAITLPTLKGRSGGIWRLT